MGTEPVLLTAERVGTEWHTERTIRIAPKVENTRIEKAAKI